MTTELEKNFFEAFDIKERELEYPDNFTYLPEITDFIWLNLIAIFLNRYEGLETYTTYTVEAIKEKTLLLLICAKEDVYKEVRELFI